MRAVRELSSDEDAGAGAGSTSKGCGAGAGAAARGAGLGPAADCALRISLYVLRSADTFEAQAGRGVSGASSRVSRISGASAGAAPVGTTAPSIVLGATDFSCVSLITHAARDAGARSDAAGSWKAKAVVTSASMRSASRGFQKGSATL